VMTVAIAAGGDPVPDSVQSGVVFRLDVGGRIDRDAFIEAVNELLRGHPHVLDDTHSDFSWGASGASLGLLVQVAEVIGGLASTGYLMEKVLAIAKGHGWSVGHRERKQVEGEWGAQAARKAVARLLDASDREVTVRTMQTTPWGTLVTVDTPFGRFQVELRVDGIDHVAKVSGD
jgi:hypothetical protein